MYLFQCFMSTYQLNYLNFIHLFFSFYLCIKYFLMSFLISSAAIFLMFITPIIHCQTYATLYCSKLISCILTYFITSGLFSLPTISFIFLYQLCINSLYLLGSCCTLYLCFHTLEQNVTLLLMITLFNMCIFFGYGKLELIQFHVIQSLNN